MATLWHVGDLIELICEFDDSPTHLTTLRRVSWSFHRAVENVWTLLLGRQNSEIGSEHVDSIGQRFRVSHCFLGSMEFAFGPKKVPRVRAVRAALTALRRTVTSFSWPWHRAEQSELSELGAMFVDMPQLQSAKITGREWLLDLTAQFGTAAQLEALLDRCPHLLSNTAKTNSRALCCTARSGNLECAIVLLQHGCDINARDEDGTAIAHVLCKHDRHEYLEGIIEAGYDVDLSVHAQVCFFAECKALPAAVDGAAESLRRVLAAGARVPRAMVIWRHPACLDVLAVAGADLNDANRAGYTVAHCAAREGQLESLRTLQKHGANMFAVSNKGETPEYLAARGGFTECLEFLTGLRVLSAGASAGA
jgi:hypothetical protein